jgi:Integron cassette protein VCH_CASS1 chain
MPIPINEIEVLRDYLAGVAKSANHHAKNVAEVAPAIAGHIVSNAENDSVKVLTRKGKMGNVLWSKIRGNKYAFSYDHDSKTIQIRKNTLRGAVMHSIDNSTTHAGLITIFSSL